jgi:hypothetical protein
MGNEGQTSMQQGTMRGRYLVIDTLEKNKTRRSANVVLLEVGRERELAGIERE